MSIELPPIPAIPSADAPAADWTRYLDIARMYVSRESSEAIDRQTAQMALMTTAAERNAALMQQFLEQPQTPASGFSEAFVMGLLRLVLDKPEAA